MRFGQALRLAGGTAALAFGVAAGWWLLPTAAKPVALLCLRDPVAACQLAQTARQTAVWRAQNERAPGKTAAPTATPQPTPSPTPAATVAPSPTQAPAPGTTVPPQVKNTAPIQAERFPQGSGTGYIALAAGSIKNGTALPDATLAAATQGALPFAVVRGSAEPQVLILHTHATETYQPWDELRYDTAFTARTKDKALNMCAVGARMAQVLNAAGINTLHDETLHDDPSYTESYARSAKTARAYLEKYPSIKVILDVHRDAIERDGARIKPLCSIAGQDTAQVMIIAGCDNGNTVNLPNWQLNLRFAAQWEAAMETRYPGLTRPVLCGYRFYNQDTTTGSLLIEIGGHGNTQPEALRAGEYAAKALAELLGA